MVDDRAPQFEHPASVSAETQIDFAAVRVQVEAFCGDCHATPAPDTFPRSAWRREVAQGYRFYAISARRDLEPPPMSDVIAYYEQLAPESLPTLPLPETASPPFSLKKQEISFTGATGSTAVSMLNWGKADDGAARMIVCDMLGGGVLSVVPVQPASEARLLGSAQNPAAATVCDLDGDGRTELIVAHLGSFAPGDHDRGGVVWIRQSPRGSDAVPLLTGLGRVADVQPIDFDGDGDQDLAVAEFGWRTTGRVLLFENRGVAHGHIDFEKRVLDPRNGAIHVPVGDLDGDGLPDLAVLFSQEHETIVAFLNRGGGEFSSETIYEAGDPAFGSSGIQLVDLDGDGDLDVLYTNGDTLDSHELKPTHGVHWLENRGAFPFVHNRLADLPGAMRAVSGDLDGDGDLDIVAAAYLSASLRGLSRDSDAATVVGLLQVAPARFEAFIIDRAAPGFMTLELGDFDGDHDVDIAAGAFDAQSDASRPWLTIWWNDTADPEFGLRP